VIAEREEKMFVKSKLRRKISKIEFVMHDIALFLDTHPKDMQAIKHYELYQGKLEELKKEYERVYGADKAIREGTWTWIEGPWPWEREYNEE